MTDVRETLSALVDGEPVDAGAVATLLEAPANRALLVDFLRLRALVREDEEPTAADGGTSATVPAATPRGAGRSWLRVAAMLALLAGGGAAGAWLERVASEEGPPEPTRTIRLEPVPGNDPAGR